MCFTGPREPIRQTQPYLTHMSAGENRNLCLAWFPCMSGAGYEEEAIFLEATSTGVATSCPEGQVFPCASE